MAVLASGRGSNFRALCEAVAAGRLPARIEVLISNVQGSGAAVVAREFGIPVIEIESRGRTREEHEERMLRALESCPADWIVLAGYMRLFSAGFVSRYWDDSLSAARIVNIHPSLLPAFPGKQGYAQALAYGVTVTGATVHLVGRGVDDGPIVAQRALDVRADDTEETLSRRGLELEHGLYVDALAALFAGNWKIGTGPGEGGRPRVVPERGERR